jgi:predicted lipase
VTGFIAVDTVNRLIVLSFRGSDSLANWIDNLDIFTVDVPDICSGCTVHMGWWDGWQSVKGIITPYIDSAISQYTGYRIVFTGHSLGGALATLGAVDLRGRGYNIDVVSAYLHAHIQDLPIQNREDAQWKINCENASIPMAARGWETKHSRLSSPPHLAGQTIGLHIPMI